LGQLESELREFPVVLETHANLWRPPTAARQRQPVNAQRTGCVQAGHTLFTLVATISFPSPFTRRPSITSCTLLAAWTLLAGNASDYEQEEDEEEEQAEDNENEYDEYQENLHNND